MGNMSILGYDPAQYHTGRAPIEASHGLRLGPDQVLPVQPRDGERRRHDGGDFAGGHPSAPAAEMIRALDDALGSGAGAELAAGVQYRRHGGAGRVGRGRVHAAAHDLADRTVSWPTGPAAPKLKP